MITERNQDGSYSIFGTLGGRPYIADMATLPGAEREHLVLKAQLIESHLVAQMMIEYVRPTRICASE
jgi:hypothetical protein